MQSTLVNIMMENEIAVQIINFLASQSLYNYSHKILIELWVLTRTSSKINESDKNCFNEANNETS